MSTCSLCEEIFAAQSVEELTDKDQISALLFLKNGAKTHTVCKGCLAKIDLIVGIKQNSKDLQIVQREEDAIKTDDASQSDDEEDEEANVGVKEEKGQNDLNDNDCEDEEDVDLEELDQLSSFYAEQDDKDPDFVPNASTKKPKKARPVKKVSKKIQLKCQICDLNFSRVFALRRHYLSDHEDLNHPEWKCKECSEVLPTKSAFISHAIDAHVELNQCKKCGKKFRLARSLRNHIANYCLEVVSHQKMCDVCSKLMPRNMLPSHRTFSHVCPNCNMILANRKEKCKHLREVHHVNKSLKSASKSNYTCRKCQLSFMSSHLLGDHVVTKHYDDFDMVTPCPHTDCKLVFPRSSSLKLRAHLKKFHGDEGEATSRLYKFQCDKCFGKFKSAENLRSHEKTKHSDDRAYCSYCDYSLPKAKKSDMIRYHLRVAHPDLAADEIREHDERLAMWRADLALRAKIQCLMCSFAGVRGSNMTRHYVDVHGYDSTRAGNALADEDMPDGALCTECGEIFNNKHALVKHLLKLHCRPGGEQCVYCSFRYTDVMTHINNMHPELKNSTGPQMCTKCIPQQSFNSFDDLLQHARAYHKKNIQYSNPASSSDGGKSSSTTSRKKAKRLCDGCGKLARHKNKECTNHGATKSSTIADQDRLGDDDNNVEVSEATMPSTKKKYVPVHLAGICPYCEFKFSDLLGHIRHNHAKEKEAAEAESGTSCDLCNERFRSVRELVTHRQLHPQFKMHACTKCSVEEFETVVELRNHRLKECTKSKRSKSKRGAKAKNTNGDSVSHESSGADNNGSSMSALNTLMMMANGLDQVGDNKKKSGDEAGPSSSSNRRLSGGGSNNANGKDNGNKNSIDDTRAPSEFEGRGTVSCHICKKVFTLKTLLRRHYSNAHNFDHTKVDEENTEADSDDLDCRECNKKLKNIHDRIKHQLDYHAILSGLICPYCDAKWGAKKFDDLDAHVAKTHVLEMQSPVQTCTTCKTNFQSYEELKVHRQIHEGGNRPRILVDVTAGDSGTDLSTYSVHPRVGARAEICNRGGLKCALCNAFKLRKDHLKVHYVKHHGYNPKAEQDNKTTDSALNIDESSMHEADTPHLECPSCSTFYANNNMLIKHLLKTHCIYSGLICPYCKGHFPSRFIDLQSHVASNHMEQLTGYNISNQYVKL